MTGPVDFVWGTRYDDFIAEAWPMIRAHWAEVGSHRDILRLNPDHDRYHGLERARMLNILTARSGGGLIGYMFMLVSKHPRDQGATAATDDLMYVRPGYRRRGVGVLMISEAERFAGEIGVNILHFHAKARRRNSSYLKRWGFTEHEIVYTKVLSEPHVVEKRAAD